ncbi:hypothetical protein Bhyg_06576 [Pseudolycoriella hygida]|uniref:Uncharacterized protein n=1 Tax=Pseudolycoriella hygida TaxID=35572 RepID=A0A9Q0N202_9DIPT|nr:hypothetical protein Bhyg_06576 [Pseudolycoriella hygida]
MPVRRGHVAPKTTLIETIIRKFDTHRYACPVRVHLRSSQKNQPKDVSLNGPGLSEYCRYLFAYAANTITKISSEN